MRSKWLVLCEQMRREGIYFKDRLTPEHLKKLWLDQLSVVELSADRETIVAHLARVPTKDRMVHEVGLAWVHPDHRRNGLGGTLLDALITETPFGHELFAITQDPTFRKLAFERGFRVVTLDSKPDLLSWAGNVGLLQEERLPRGSVSSNGYSNSLGERCLLFRAR
jgi:hypothetical protein